MVRKKLNTELLESLLDASDKPGNGSDEYEGITRGWCPICEKGTFFLLQGNWIRDQLLCIRCNSIPRWRALIHVLETYFPDWREQAIHESSPGGGSSDKLKQECKHYIPSHFFPDVPLGSCKNNFQCENLEKMTFPDSCFDLVITQDVLEHIFNPAKAFREIARTLKPGGAHVFTVPWFYKQETRVRAVLQDGQITNVLEPEYPGNPIDANGSLVVTDFGRDLCSYIYERARMLTTVIRSNDKQWGVETRLFDLIISE